LLKPHSPRLALADESKGFRAPEAIPPIVVRIVPLAFDETFIRPGTEHPLLRAGFSGRF
jgi:hypothetical protein